MTDEQETTQKEPGTPFDFSCCRGWSRMGTDQAKGWDWAEMISRMMDTCRGMGSEPAAPDAPGTPFGFSCCGDWSRRKPEQPNDWDWAGMMSKMMDMCRTMGSESAGPDAPGTPDNII